METLKDFMSNVEESEDSAQKATHLNFPNPEHPETSVDEEDMEEAMEWYDAATYIKASGVNRTRLVGNFLKTVAKADREGDDETLEVIFSLIRNSDQVIEGTEEAEEPSEDLMEDTEEDEVEIEDEDIELEEDLEEDTEDGEE